MTAVCQAYLFKPSACRFTLLSIWLLPAFVGTCVGRRTNALAGPYDIIYRGQVAGGPTNSSSDKIWYNLNVTPSVRRQPQYSWGTSFNSIPIDDNLKVEVWLSKWADNQWKDNAFVVKYDKACSAMMAQTRGFGESLFADDGKGCPVKVSNGIRTIANHTLKISFPNIPVFPYGRWKFNMKLVNKTEIINVLSIDGHIVPK